MGSSAALGTTPYAGVADEPIYPSGESSGSNFGSHPSLPRIKVAAVQLLSLEGLFPEPARPVVPEVIHAGLLWHLTADYEQTRSASYCKALVINLPTEMRARSMHYAVP